MQRTLQQLTALVERELAQYAGASVQLYAEPVIQQRLQQAFDYCFELKYWPQFLVREQRTLDGITGKVTAVFTSILQWSDVQYVFRKFSDRPIAELPRAFNTLNLTGSTLSFVQPRTDAYLFTAYPLTSTDIVEVVGRARPASLFLSTDIVPFDDWALVHYATWSYLIDDASNSAAAAKEQGLFDIRIKMLTENSEKGIVHLNPHRANNVPNRWNEM